MKPIHFILSALGIAATAVLMVFMAGAPAAIYWDAPSLLVLLGIQILVSLGFASPTGFIKAFRDPFLVAPAPADLRKARSFWAGQTPMSLIISGFGGLFGAIAILNMPSSPENLAKGAALASLMLFYALFLNLVLFYPYRLLCERRLAE